jgi:WD40 repeat protein
LPPEIEPRSADISAVVQGTFHSVVSGTKCAALDNLTAITWSSSGSILATAGNSDGSIRIWGRTDRKQVARLTGHEAAVISISWSPDGRYLAPYDKGKNAILWDTGSWAQTANLFVHNGDQYSARTIQWAPDGKHLGINSNDGIQYMSIDNPNVYGLFCDWPCGPEFSFSPDGKKIAAFGFYGSDGYRIKIWNISTKELTASLLSVEGQYMTTLAWSPDGTTIAAAVPTLDSHSITPMVWFWRMDTQTRAEPKNPITYEGPIEDAVWAPDSSQVASGGYDGTVLLWDPASGEPWYVFGPDKIGLPSMIGACALAWSPDGNLLAIAFTSGKVVLWDVPPISSE